MKKLFAQSFDIIRRHKRAYIILNLTFAGFYIAGLLIAYYYPDMHYAVNTKINDNFNNAVRFSLLKEFYFTNPNFILAAGLTFLTNLLAACFAEVSLSSVIVPFLGFIIIAGQFLYFGIWSPALYIYPVLIMEFSAMCLAALGVYAHYSRIFKPQNYGLASRKEGFKEGLKLQARLYPLIAAILLFSAVVEVSISFGLGGAAPDPFVSRPLASAQPSDKLISTYRTRSVVFYDTVWVAQTDARVAGLYLEDVNYFRASKRGGVRISLRDSLLTLELGVKKENWNNKKTYLTFSKLLGNLKEYAPSKKFQIVMFDLGQNGNKVEQVFKE